MLVRRAQLRVNRRQRRLLAREFLVEVGRVGRAFDGREVRRWDPFVVDIVKVDIFEEEVSLDVLRVGLASSQSSGRVARKQLDSCQLEPSTETTLAAYPLKKRDSVPRHGDGVQRLILEDGVEDLVLVVASER